MRCSLFRGGRGLQYGGLFFVSKLLQVCDDIFMNSISRLFYAVPHFLDSCIDIAILDKWLQLVVGNNVGWNELEGKPDVLRIIKGRAKIHVGHVSGAIGCMGCSDDTVPVCFDGFHGSSVRGNISVIVKAVAAYSDSGSVDF